jgi:hypothetical protein
LVLGEPDLILLAGLRDRERRQQDHHDEPAP